MGTVESIGGVEMFLRGIMTMHHLDFRRLNNGGDINRGCMMTVLMAEPPSS